MRIIVPEEIGSELKLLPEGVVRATLEKLMLGKSGSGYPKVTARYLITEEMEGVKEGEPPTTGEVVLETFSLQPQAMFGLNSLYKAVTGERIPQGDFSPEEFMADLDEKLTDTEWDLVLEQQIPGNLDIEGMSEAEIEKAKRTVVVKRELAA